MAKLNPLALQTSPRASVKVAGPKGPKETLRSPRAIAGGNQSLYPSLSRVDIEMGRNNLFNLKSFNELKKDQTNIKIFKNSSFDSSFNSVQSLNTNLSNLEGRINTQPKGLPPVGTGAATLATQGLDPKGGVTGGSAIIRAIRTIRLNRDEWKLIRYINLMEKKLRSCTPFGSPLGLTTNSTKFKSKTFSLPSSPAPKGVPFEEVQSIYPPKAQLDPRVVSSPQVSRETGPLKGNSLPSTRKSRGAVVLRETLKRQETSMVDPKGLPSGQKEKKSIYIKQNNKIFSYNNIISKNILLRNMKYNFLKSTLSSILKKKIRRISEILEDKPIKNYVLYSYLKFCIFTPPHFNVPALSPAQIDSKRLRASERVLRDSPLVTLGPCVATPFSYFYSKFNNKKSELLRNGSVEEAAGGVLGRAKLSLNKYKGRKFGSFINYNKIIGYKFNSTFYQAYPNCLAPFAPPALPKQLTLSLRMRSTQQKQGVATQEQGKAPKCQGVLEKNRGNIYIKDTYKLLFYLFKSMYCLISKPVLKYTNDKVTIQLFYYLNIPKKKVFRLFSIFYINSIKKKWLAHIERKKTNFISLSRPSPLERPLGSNPLRGTFGGEGPYQLPTLPSLSLAKVGETPDPLGESIGGEGRILGRTYMPRGNTKIYIRWKLRKAISRLKNKITPLLRNPAKGQLDPRLNSKPLSPQKSAQQPHSLRLASGGIGSSFGPPLGSRPLGWGARNNLLFKLRKFNLTAKAVFQNKFKLICAILSKKFNKPVELQLIRLHHPYHDSNILVNLLSLNIKNKRKKARVAIQKIYNKKPVKNLNDPNLILTELPTAEPLVLRQPLGSRGTGNLTPAFLSGLNIKIAGRLMGEPIIPRITTKVFGKGASATGKVNFLDVARITNKNRKGAYTIKITSGQNFF